MDSSFLDGGSLAADLDARVQSEMRDGERLLWVEQPRPGRFARQAIPIALFGVPFTAFAVFWMVMSSGLLFGGFAQNVGPGGIGWIFAVCFPLFGLPFLVIGLGMLSSPYWFRLQAKRTVYALTDQRAILWQVGWFGAVNVRSYGPEALGKLYRTEYADGTGNLIFEEVVSMGRMSDGRRTTSVTRHGFIAIGEVRQVEELLRKVLLRKGG